MKALDLFCGMGGLAYGFTKTGFTVTGIDINKKAGSTFSFNHVGDFVLMDLTRCGVRGEYDVVIGGPPCEPWSCLNLRRRGSNHPKYECITAFFREVRIHMPIIFIMENVPAIQSDNLFMQTLESMKEYYDICPRIVRYSDYGAAFARHRFFLIGIKLGIGIEMSTFIDTVKREKPVTVREAIGNLKYKEPDVTVDHVWPNLKTIHKYMDYYKTGKYGWYILKWDEPSSSFGNVTKTYILHPESFNNGKDARPISVREALRIVGFPDEYKFPLRIGLGMKYEMISDAVSPVFSLKLAEAVKNIIAPYC